MNACTHIVALLQEYLDGTLPPAARASVETHLRTCAACRKEKEALASVISSVHALPRSLDPPSDLWPAIAARLDPPVSEDSGTAINNRTNNQSDRRPRPGRSRRARFRAVYAAIGIAAAVVIASVVLLSRSAPSAWNITRLEGTPSIGPTPVANTAKLHPGDWLTTDGLARASVDVGLIGQVDVEPHTRLQLLRARRDDHRIALTEGTIHARIWAPPRLFFVETPSALAIDLGCAYTLHVDSTGGSILHVTSGYVELQHGERTAVVPAGSMCLTRPGQGPGTPFDEEATEAFRRALARFDFEDDGAATLDALFEAARPADAPTLWRLMYKIDGADRARLYDHLVTLVSPPADVTRDEVLQADLDAIEAWDEHLGLDLDSGWFLRLYKKTAD